VLWVVVYFCKSCQRLGLGWLGKILVYMDCPSTARNVREGIDFVDRSVFFVSTSFRKIDSHSSDVPSGLNCTVDCMRKAIECIVHLVRYLGPASDDGIAYWFAF
jgi:hypothetical protein